MLPIFTARLRDIQTWRPHVAFVRLSTRNKVMYQRVFTKRLRWIHLLGRQYGSGLTTLKAKYGFVKNKAAAVLV
jgi:hypothetical protein